MLFRDWFSWQQQPTRSNYKPSVRANFDLIYRSLKRVMSMMRLSPGFFRGNSPNAMMKNKHEAYVLSYCSVVPVSSCVSFPHLFRSYLSVFQRSKDKLNCPPVIYNIIMISFLFVSYNGRAT